MTISRRAFVSGVAAAALTRPAHAASVPRDADIVIVGAGAAGIAAARRVMAANRKVIVIEAGERVGGRCVTDMTTFAVPFDRGARFIHLPDTNPLARLARPVGLDVFPLAQGQKIRIGRRHARAGEIEDFHTTLVKINRAIGEAARGRSDVSMAAAIPADVGEWAPTASFLLGPQATGKDAKDISVLDLARATPRDISAVCRQGLGTLVAKLGEGVPLALTTPATAINWSGGRVAVEVDTPSGRISARAVIVTVSTNVLRAGQIRFGPDLPKRQLDAAAGLSLGSLDRIALELPGNPLGLSRDDVVIERADNPRSAVLMANIGGSSLCTIEVAGSFGRDLAAQGEAAMVAFGVEWLTKLYGSDIASAVKRSSATRWNEQPFTRGAFSVASPGSQGARKILMEPVGAMYFAGEAVHETLWGTVGGAWESGERAAEAALRRIGALKDPNDPKAAPKKRRG